MIVNHYNTFPYGGAANAALRLHVELQNQSVASRFLFSQQDRPVASVPDLYQLPWSRQPHSTGSVLQSFLEKQRTRRIHRLYDNHLAERRGDREVFSMPELVDRTRHSNPDFVSGIVHLHWIAFMADYPTFFGSLPASTPIVWTLHDMNPLTGGCHYSDGCQNFSSGCGHCPQVVNAGASDISQAGFRVKRRSLRTCHLTVVAPSQWLKKLAENSPVFPKTTTFHHIRLGFDLKRLYPLPKRAARESLGIDGNKMLIGFGAESIENRRKGLDLLLRALAQLKSTHANVECIVFGAGNFDSSDLDLPRIHELGYLNGETEIAKFYSACDFVVVPSREDNQPQVALEAMACGTPVVAFDVGGVGEFVQPGVTGWLARPEDPQHLADQMQKLIDDTEARANLSARCRQLMLQEFDIVEQARKYVRLYRRVGGHQRISNVA